MAKDSKGHGSNSKGWGHEQHHSESQRLLKERVTALKAGDKRKATDLMAKAKEHADEARHKQVQARRVAAGQTMKQRMASGTAPKMGAAKKRK